MYFAAYIHVDIHVWLLNEPYHEKACFVYTKTKARVTVQLIIARFIASTIPLFNKSLAIFSGCKSQFVLDRFDNPKDRVPRDKAGIQRQQWNK